MSVAQVAAQLGVSKATVYKLCDTGAIGHLRVVNSIRVRSSALQVFIASGCVG
jgi:excisionase family DNA binding protein